MKTIILMFLLALSIMMASPPRYAYDQNSQKAVTIDDVCNMSASAIFMDTGPPCNFASYINFANATTMTTDVIVSQPSNSSDENQATTINRRNHNTYTLKSNAQGVPATARDAVIQASLRDFRHNIYSRADQRMEVALFEPDLVTGSKPYLILT